MGGADVRYRVVLGLVVCMLGVCGPAHATTATLTADREEPQPAGTSIRWTVAAAEGQAPYTFKWWLWDGERWTLLQDWTTQAVYAWRPLTANRSYRLGVWVRSASTTADAFDTTATAYFEVTPGAATLAPSEATPATVPAAPPPAVTPAARVSAVDLRVDREAPQRVGTAVTASATPVGGVPPYSYKWWLWDGAVWGMLRDWSADSTLKWIPERANPGYRLGVWVRSAVNALDEFESTGTQYFEIVGQPPAPAAEVKVEAVDLTADRAEPQPAGTTITFTARPTGGRAPYGYKWWLWDGTSWGLLEDWSGHATLRWRPTAANRSYRLGVWVRSAGRDADAFESTGTQYFEIGPPGTSPQPASSGTADCVRVPSPALLTFGSGGGTSVLQVETTTAACAWSSASLASWVRLSPALPRTGAAPLTISVSANDAVTARNGVIRIGSQDVVVVQGGQAARDGCTYAVFPTQRDLPPAATVVSFSVTAPPGCAWDAHSSAGFIRPVLDGGEGTGVIDVAVEENREDATRADVVTIAGRAVTLTQRGESSPSAPCQVEPALREVSVASGGTSQVLAVAAPSGCSWDADVSESFLHLVGGTSGSGDGTLRIVVDANSGDARAGVLRIGSARVTIAQAGAVVEVPCVFTLSASTASLSHAGGGGVVTVTTDPWCQWGSISRASWVQVTETTGGQGSGSVWFSVDANSGDVRSGTLVVAGQALVIDQAAPPSTAAGDQITWSIPPDADRVGQCPGNCGAGCGTFFNPCGGSHYWEHQLVTEPQYVGDDWEPVCTESSSWIVVRPRYTAVARWVYHGVKSDLCADHDASCRAVDLIPFLPIDRALCLVTAGVVGLNGLNYCDGAQAYEWSYEFVDIGHGEPVAFLDGAPSCQ